MKSILLIVIALATSTSFAMQNEATAEQRLLEEIQNRNDKQQSTADLERLKILIKEVPNLNQKVESRININLSGFPLYWAISAARPDIVKALLDAGASVNYDNTDETALHTAIYRSQDPKYNANLIKIAEELLSRGADVNAKIVYYAHTPLLSAAGIGNVEMVKFLLSHGANPNIQNIHGYTPLTWAQFRLRTPFNEPEENERLQTVIDILKPITHK